MTTTIGRNKERTALESYIASNRAELIALYGRRRIGKTFLIRSCFENQELYLEFTGIRKGSQSRQLKAFISTIAKKLFANAPLETPQNWEKAFEFLSQQLIKQTKKKIILFFDELPWMVTRRSNFMQEFEYYWNTLWSKQKNIKIILCGSAASWMLDNIINAQGGLHNRITQTLLLKPFDLATTKQFLEFHGCKFSMNQLVELYMVTGGVPYYLEQIQKSKSIVQNIQALCFEQNGILYDEFDRLFKSLYEHSEINFHIIRTLATKREGMSRELLLTKTKLTSGGSFNKRINELEAAGFIKGFVPYGKQSRDIFYKVIDEFCLFYLRWIEPTKKSGHASTAGYWHKQQNTASWQSWSGYAFESICFKHIEQIRHALGLQHTGIHVASWQYKPKETKLIDGAQIDLLFDRDDAVITIFEIKYSANSFIIDKAYAKALVKKMDVFAESVKTKKQLILVMIAANGLKTNLYSEDLVNQVLTSADLF